MTLFYAGSMGSSKPWQVDAVPIVEVRPFPFALPVGNFVTRHWRGTFAVDPAFVEPVAYLFSRMLHPPHCFGSVAFETYEFFDSVMMQKSIRSSRVFSPIVLGGFCFVILDVCRFVFQL